MSTEISAGFPTDGRIFEPPQANQDNSRPHYVTFLGSLVDADIIRSRPWTKGGGMEITNPCLRYVKNFLRKGRITPVLLDKHDFQSYDVVKKMMDADPLSSGYFGQSIPQGYVPPALPPSSGMHHHGFGGVMHVGGPSPYGNLVAKAAYPGEQIHAIVMGDENVTNTNIMRGVVELKTLLGHDYRPTDIDGAYVDPDIWQIQRTIFPDYPSLPILLDEIEELLDAATIHTSLRAIADEMMTSLSQFRDYASATIQQVHQSMKESGGGDAKYFYRYTSMDLVLLEQLGMARQDKEIRQQAQGGGDSDVKELLRRQSEVQTAWMQAQIEEKQALTELHKRQAAMIDGNTMAAAAIAPEEGYSGYGGQSGYSGFSGGVTIHLADVVDPNPRTASPEVQAAFNSTAPQVVQTLGAIAIPGVKMFTCEHCGQEMKLTGKSFHLNKWCPVLHPKAVTEEVTEVKE